MRVLYMLTTSVVVRKAAENSLNEIFPSPSLRWVNHGDRTGEMRL